VNTAVAQQIACAPTGMRSMNTGIRALRDASVRVAAQADTQLNAKAVYLPAGA